METSVSPPKVELSALVVPLLKGVIYRENNASQWNGLLTLASRVRDYVAVLGLDLVLDFSISPCRIERLIEPSTVPAGSMPAMVSVKNPPASAFASWTGRTRSLGRAAISR